MEAGWLLTVICVVLTGGSWLVADCYLCSADCYLCGADWWKSSQSRTLSYRTLCVALP